MGGFSMLKRQKDVYDSFQIPVDFYLSLSESLQKYLNAVVSRVIRIIFLIYALT